MDIPSNATAHQRLAIFVRNRREELGMTQAQVQAAGGPSGAAIRYIEAGREAQPTQRTVSAIERALQWAPGSINAILAGGEPTIAAPQDNQDLLQESVAEMADQIATIQRLLMEQERMVREAQVLSTRVDGDVLDMAKILAAQEGRSIGGVIADALNLYNEVMGAKK